MFGTGVMAKKKKQPVPPRSLWIMLPDSIALTKRTENYKASAARPDGRCAVRALLLMHLGASWCILMLFSCWSPLCGEAWCVRVIGAALDCRRTPAALSCVKRCLLLSCTLEMRKDAMNRFAGAAAWGAWKKQQSKGLAPVTLDQWCDPLQPIHIPSTPMSLVSARSRSLKPAKANVEDKPLSF